MVIQAMDGVASAFPRGHAALTPLAGRQRREMD